MEARVGTGKVGELADMMERHYVDTVYCLCRRPGERKQVMSLGGGFKNWGGTRGDVCKNEGRCIHMEYVLSRRCNLKEIGDRSGVS